MKRFKGELYVLLAAIIWGTAFIFQKMGMDYIGPFTFGAFRFTIGALSLLPVILLYDKRKKKQGDKQIAPFRNKELLIGALFCGIANFVAGSLQQIGLVYTTAGKAGFITAMDIVIVPILLLVLRRRVEFITWIGIAIACFGLYLLCITEGFSIQIGDSFVMGCAVAYSFQILLIDHYAKRVDVLKLSCLQFLLAGVLSAIAAVFVETIDWQSVVACAIPILYVGILEVGVAFTCQIVGQKTTPPAIATIIMTLESPIAAVSGVLFLGEIMTGREITGSILMLVAFFITQVPDFKNSENRGEEK